VAHKIFSPQTYACNLCALTHSNFRVRKEWKQFIETLNRPVEFLHADELKQLYGIEGKQLPVILKKDGELLETLVETASINACRTLADLKHLIINRLERVQ
jgi:hypothetical protein